MRRRIGFDDFAPGLSVPGLVVRCPMDDDPTTGTVTASSSAYDGTCAVCPMPTSGKFSGGYAFDGSTFATLPALSTGLVGVAPYTVTAWILPRLPVNQGTVTEKAYELSGDPNVLKMAVHPGGEPAFETANPAIDILTANLVVTDGTWHCLAEAWDGSKKHFFVDSVLVAMASVVVVDSTLPMQIGADLDSGIVDDYYQGTIDELRFYNRALDATEVAVVCHP